MNTVPRDVVMRSLSLLRELNHAYGNKKAMEVWEKMEDAIDDADLKMEIFKVMLAGGYTGTHVEVRKWDKGDRKVTAIKALRQVTNSGLKEAKEAVENAGNYVRSRHELRILLDSDGNRIDPDFHEIIRSLEETGLEVELV